MGQVKNQISPKKRQVPDMRQTLIWTPCSHTFVEAYNKEQLN